MHCLPWWRKHHGFYIKHHDTYTHLTEKWFWHHKTNDKHRNFKLITSHARTNKKNTSLFL
jgi:hypothetical protein